MVEVWNDCHFGVLDIGARYLAFTMGADVLLAVLRSEEAANDEC